MQCRPRASPCSTPFMLGRYAFDRAIAGSWRSAVSRPPSRGNELGYNAVQSDAHARHRLDVVTELKRYASSARRGACPLVVDLARSHALSLALTQSDWAAAPQHPTRVARLECRRRCVSLDRALTPPPAGSGAVPTPTEAMAVEEHGRVRQHDQQPGPESMELTFAETEALERSITAALNEAVKSVLAKGVPDSAERAPHILTLIAEDLLKQVAPSRAPTATQGSLVRVADAMVAGGIGVREGENVPSYSSSASEWVEQGLVPRRLEAERTEGAIRMFGPLSIQRATLLGDIAHLEEAAGKLKKDRSYQFSSELVACRTAKARAELVQVDQLIDKALSNLRRATNAGASLISGRLELDKSSYDQALADAIASEPGELERMSVRAAELCNVGPLREGQIVHVVTALDRSFEASKNHSELAVKAINGEVSCALRAAKVRAVLDNGTYDVALWREWTNTYQGYREGFDETDFGDRKQFTNDEAADTQVINAPRVRLYSSASKTRQVLSAESIKRAKQRGVHPLRTDDLSFLLLLFADAESTLPYLSRLGEQLRSAQVMVLEAPLKALPRTIAKTLEKYGGDFSRLTDLARMTLVCTTLAAARGVLEAMASDSAIQIMLIKNRLMLEYDASDTGGYRDMLINVRCLATGHIFEVQITLEAFYKIKSSGGHVSYRMARLLKLNEPSSFHHFGPLTEHALESIGNGVITHLQMSGECNLANLFEQLCTRLGSDKCRIKDVEMVNVDWPAGRTLLQLLMPLQKAGKRLKRIVIRCIKLPVGSEIPESFFDNCQKLSYVSFGDTSIGGVIPLSFGKLSEMTHCQIWGNAFTNGYSSVSAHVKHLLVENGGKCELLWLQ